MLILTRRIGERIVIGDNVTVAVLGFSGKGQVRIGIEAPDDVSVHREEIYQKIQNQTEPYVKPAPPVIEPRIRAGLYGRKPANN